MLGKKEFHTGIDIATNEGTEVVAVRSGAVTKVGVSNTYGNYVKYATEDGYEVMYAHLSRVLVDENAEVKKGEVVALSGNTGLSTGPHLHYGLSKKDELIDPMDFVELEYTQEVVEEYKKRGEVMD